MKERGTKGEDKLQEEEEEEDEERFIFVTKSESLSLGRTAFQVMMSLVNLRSLTGLTRHLTQWHDFC